ncbi:Conserved hypothetical protein [Oleispira antarctica RB-8]|uniref:Lipoprotein n=1 Tax=Oleispira antarctica RB-8 TaxID=698738 RepID=R4YP09_OLEAN|nr:Conserved hypothetical protein [Oleispira antarctica RB-8]
MKNTLLNRLSNTVINTVLLLVVLLLAGCGQPILPKFIKESKWSTSYEVHYEYQTEVWDDPDVLSTPRVQFRWARPGLSDYKDMGIWSMRLDGSDIREVVSPELLFSTERGAGRSVWSMPRSPNNRYIAIKLGTQNLIIDLETKQVIELSRGRDWPSFQWLPDSDSLLYNTAKGVKQYHLATGKDDFIEPRFRDDGIWGHWFLLDGGRVITMEGWDGIYTYDFASGELLDKRPGDFDSRRRQKLSADGKYYIKASSRGGSWVSVEEPNTVIQKIPDLGGGGESFAGMTLGQRLYSSYSGKNREGIEVIDGDLAKPSNFIFPNRERTPGNLSFYNTGY